MKFFLKSVFDSVSREEARKTVVKGHKSTSTSVPSLVAFHFKRLSLKTPPDFCTRFTSQVERRIAEADFSIYTDDKSSCLSFQTLPSIDQ